MTKKILNERLNFYSNLNKNINLITEKEILYKFSIENNELFKIRKLVKELITNNLKIYFKNKIQIKSSKKNYLIEYKNLINKLPNITPGGLIQPRKEIAKFYNKIHKELVKLLKKKKLIENFYSCSRINLRFKDGIKVKRNRKYSTFKPHSDSWNGHSSSSIFMMGIEGDISNNTVFYYKPIRFKNSFFKTMKSFDYGKKFFSSKKYIGKLEENQIIIIDQLCLHKTDISSSIPRISLDFAITLKKAKKSKMEFKKIDKKYKYFLIKNWKKINHLNLDIGKTSIFDELY